MQLNNVGLILMRRQALCHVHSCCCFVVRVVSCCFAIPSALLSSVSASSSQLGHATFAFAHAHFPYSQTQTLPRMSESCDLENSSTENIERKEYIKREREREREKEQARENVRNTCSKPIAKGMTYRQLDVCNKNPKN